METPVKLPSISGHQNSLKKLIRTDGSPSYTYALISEASVWDIRVSKELRTVKWIDPPGGPRISVGEPIRGTDFGVVKYIDKTDRYYVITFEHDISSHEADKDILGGDTSNLCGGIPQTA